MEVSSRLKQNKTSTPAEYAQTAMKFIAKQVYWEVALLDPRLAPNAGLRLGPGLCNVGLGKARLRNMGGLPRLLVPVGNSWNKCRLCVAAENCEVTHKF